MKIPFTGIALKTFLILLDCLSIALATYFIFESKCDLFSKIFLIVISLVLCIILFVTTLLAFANYEINDKGITFEHLIYRNFYKWSDFKFIAKYNTQFRLTVENGFIFSHKLEKSNFKRIHTTIDFSTKYFNIPYSKELENYILIYASNNYEGLLIDDSKSE